MNRLLCLLALCLSGCYTAPIVREPMTEVAPSLPPPLEEQHFNPPPNRCPPLPIIRENATRFEGRLWTLTVTALYAQCAASKDDK